jgi:plasmid rolling circle replication initiator protein Rep
MTKILQYNEFKEGIETLKQKLKGRWNLKNTICQLDNSRGDFTSRLNQTKDRL